MLTIRNVATTQNFEVKSYKFNVVEMCTVRSAEMNEYRI